MATKKIQPWAADAWQLTRSQHGVVTRRQLIELGMPPGAIRARIEGGHLHPIWGGIYSVGRPEVGRLGRFKAATLACGREAQLSHRSGANLWGLDRSTTAAPVHVTVPDTSTHRRRGIRLHRRAQLETPRMVRGIPVGDPVSILVDLAGEASREQVEDAVNEADRLNLVPTHRLRVELDSRPARPGIGRLKAILDAQTFSRAQNALERRFLVLVSAAAIPPPVTQERLGRHRVDFFWPAVGLVVETDSLRHHRTAAEQAADLTRDQTHARAGRHTLRFTHSQVFHRPDYVRRVLRETYDHLVRGGPPKAIA